MARATWKGFLKISLVNVPIKVFPAHESSATLSFNQLHRECQTRIQQKRWCVTCQREVPTAEIVKGYEFTPGRYVVLSDEDFDRVRPESTRIIDLVQFDDDVALDLMYVDKTYYLAPDGAIAAQAYAVIREAMRAKVGVGKLALYGREYLVAVRPHAHALVLHTLHHAGELRSIDVVDELRAVPLSVNADETRLARQVIAAFDRPLDLSTFTDAYRLGLQRVIDAKIAGDETVSVVPPAPMPVADLMEALTKSLQAVKKTPAKAAAADRPRKRA